LNFFVLHCANGGSFFTGIIVLLFAVLVASRSQKKVARAAVRALVLIAFVLIALSATPITPAFYGVLGAGTIVWVVLSSVRAEKRSRASTVLRWIVVGVCLAGVGAELPYHLRPRVPGGPFSRLYVIGDSISAGLYSRDRTWPRVLREEQGVDIVDLSRDGETAGSAAQEQAPRIKTSDGAVLLEIGGNDLLGVTPVSMFAQDLRDLLEVVCVQGRTVLMFELPLPVTHVRYGYIQRRLAKEFDVTLIPKRCFTYFLSGELSTHDTIHLSDEGHRKLARVVWDLVGDKMLPAGAPANQRPASQAATKKEE